jgi:hypothetical protein
MAKLAIVADREEDKYEHVTTFRCYACDSSSGKEITGLSASPEARQLIKGILQSMSSGRQSEVQAWEEEITPCEHTLMLEQLAMGPIAPSGAQTSFFIKRTLADIITQVWPTVGSVISRKTSGSVSPAARLAVDASNMVEQAEMGMV